MGECQYPKYQCDEIKAKKENFKNKKHTIDQKNDKILQQFNYNIN
jgi:hypothetical protein